MSFTNSEKLDSFDVTRPYVDGPRNGSPSLITIKSVTQPAEFSSTFYVYFVEVIPSFPGHLGFGAFGTGDSFLQRQYVILLPLSEFVPIMTILSSDISLNVRYDLTLDPYDLANEGKLVYLDKFDLRSMSSIVIL